LIDNVNDAIAVLYTRS